MNLRTVVLRKAIPTSREIRFHTDIRSKKWNKLKLNETISGLFYDDQSCFQLRVKGKAILNFNNAITSEAWQKTSLSSRRCYLTQTSPSVFFDIPTSGLSEDIEQENFL